MIANCYFIPPIRIAVAVAVAVAVFFCAADAALAQAKAPAGKLDPTELVIGDWYEVSTTLIPEGDEPREPIHGALVKKTK